MNIPLSSFRVYDMSEKKYLSKDELSAEKFITMKFDGSVLVDAPGFAILHSTGVRDNNGEMVHDSDICKVTLDKQKEIQGKVQFMYGGFHLVYMFNTKRVALSELRLNELETLEIVHNFSIQ